MAVAVRSVYLQTYETLDLADTHGSKIATFSCKTLTGNVPGCSFGDVSCCVKTERNV